MSQKCVLKCPTENKSTLFQIMAWHRTADKQLFNQCLFNLVTPRCVTRSQWVKYNASDLSHELYDLRQSIWPGTYILVFQPGSFPPVTSVRVIHWFDNIITRHFVIVSNGSFINREAEVTPRVCNHGHVMSDVIIHPRPSSIISGNLGELFKTFNYRVWHGLDIHY